MNCIESPSEMQAWSLKQRREGQTIAFVPTMGALHEGHLSLLREGEKKADRLVMSLFVNPLQFGPTEDFGKYPRDTQGDLTRAKQCGVDVVFCPTALQMYPPDHQTTVAVQKLSEPLCGAHRPGHFEGVATVVLKLFNIVLPHVAFFGEKDYQQLCVIRQMVADLHLPVTICPMPIVREPDGLAMSSRNRFLSAEEREAARAIPESLKIAEKMAAGGVRNIQEILTRVRERLLGSPQIQIDYAALCDPVTLEVLETLKPLTLLAVACRIGKTRFIDNCLIRTEIASIVSGLRGNEPVAPR